MTNLERIMKDLQTTIGEKQKNHKPRKPRKSTRADGTNPRAKGTNPTTKGTNPKARRYQALVAMIIQNPNQQIWVNEFDEVDWDHLMSLDNEDPIHEDNKDFMRSE